MKNSFRKLIALFLSLIIAFNAGTCFMIISMDYEMLFDRSLMFSNNNTFNAWFYDTKKYSQENSDLANARAWAYYFEDVYSVGYLKEFIYRYSSEFTTYDKELKKLTENRLKIKNIAHKERFFIDFLELALDNEKLINESRKEVWDESEKVIDYAHFASNISIVESKISNSTDTFQKERLAYQLIKLYRYSNQFAKVTEIYQNYFSTPKSLISFWAMDHYAGALLQLGQKSKANYYFTKVYINCNSKRMSSYLSISIDTDQEFQSTLNYCSTIEEKMALYYIRAMNSKNNGLEDLKTITGNLGNHEYSQIIMAHELNKIEKIILAREENNDYSGDENEAEKIHIKLIKSQLPNYLKELIDFNQTMHLKYPKDQFWNLTLAYLYYLNKDHSKCSEQLNTLQPTSKDVLKQHNIR
ncbi:MAG: hypothetical protein EB100_08260, partial [Crocinitomicaceae bacterium]|nr:hypothetical protein [Crocinitomicaceae bacterium]